MTHRITAITVSLLAFAILGLSPARAAEPRTLNVVVVTGGHDFDRAAFPKVFQGYDDVRVTFADQKDDSELFEDISDWKYDVILLYNMGQKITPKREANFIKLLDKGVGLVATHHCIAAWQGWPEYARMIGGKHFLKPTEWDGVKYKQSQYKHDVDVPVKVEDPAHPVVAGVKDFVIHDETYKGQWIDPKAHLLLSTTESSSDSGLAWVSTYGKGRVVYLELGHDAKAYENANYRKLIYNAIRWAAGTADK